MFSEQRTLCGSSCSHPQVSVLPSLVPHLKDASSENRVTSFLFCLSVYELSTNDNNYHYVCYFSSSCGKTPGRHYLRGGRVCLGWGSEGSVSHCQEVKVGEAAEREKGWHFVACLLFSLIRSGTSHVAAAHIEGGVSRSSFREAFL